MSPPRPFPPLGTMPPTRIAPHVSLAPSPSATADFLDDYQQNFYFSFVFGTVEG